VNLNTTNYITIAHIQSRSANVKSGTVEWKWWKGKDREMEGSCCESFGAIVT
jgi:hypothetical protein